MTRASRRGYNPWPGLLQRLAANIGLVAAKCTDSSQQTMPVHRQEPDLLPECALEDDQSNTELDGAKQPTRSLDCQAFRRSDQRTRLFPDPQRCCGIGLDCDARGRHSGTAKSCLVLFEQPQHFEQMSIAEAVQRNHWSDKAGIDRTLPPYALVFGEQRADSRRKQKHVFV